MRAVEMSRKTKSPHELPLGIIYEVWKEQLDQQYQTKFRISQI